jgi:hypothetical protein
MNNYGIHIWIMIFTICYSAKTVPLCNPAIFPKVIGENFFDSNIRALEYAEKHDFLAAIGCTRSNSIRSYGGSPMSPMVIIYEVSTMNIIWEKHGDEVMLIVLLGVFSRLCPTRV